MLPLLLSAAASAALTLCADRPSKSTALCTVPDAHWQLETELTNRSLDRSGGERAIDLSFGSTVVKRGIGPATDIQVTLPAFHRLSTRSDEGRAVRHGFDDLRVAAKHRLTGEDATLGAALVGYATLPTGRSDIGAGAVEAGVIVPLQLGLGQDWSLQSSPEADWRADDDGRGHHGAISTTLNLGVPLSDAFSMSIEGWAERERDGGHTARRASADVNFAFTPSKRIQFDAGAYVGLTRDTPDLELYWGIAALF